MGVKAFKAAKLAKAGLAAGKALKAAKVGKAAITAGKAAKAGKAASTGFSNYFVTISITFF